MQQSIMSIDNPVELTIKKRPSKICKSPYVADAFETDELLHTASLGCFGLVEQHAKVICSKKENSKGKCKYMVQLGFDSESNTYISTNPLLANKISEILLKDNKINFNFKYNIVNTEQTIGNSRFDFVLEDEINNRHVVEVKSVPIAFYENLPVKEYRKRSYDGRDTHSKIGIFPVGYRKNKNSPISERAIKHLKELGRLVKDKEIASGTCLFVVGRSDVNQFSPSKDDPFYCSAIKEALDDGVNIKAIKLEWINNKVYYLGEIPVVTD